MADSEEETVEAEVALEEATGVASVAARADSGEVTEADSVEVPVAIEAVAND